MSRRSPVTTFSFFFEYLGGIRTEECAPGFSTVVLEPFCFEEFGSCTVSYMTPHGEIVSHWHFDEGKLIYNHTVPNGVRVIAREPHIIYKR